MAWTLPSAATGQVSRHVRYAWQSGAPSHAVIDEAQVEATHCPHGLPPKPDCVASGVDVSGEPDELAVLQPVAPNMRMHRIARMGDPSSAPRRARLYTFSWVRTRLGPEGSRRMRATRLATWMGLATGVAGEPACSNTAPPRPEIVLYVDTDAHVVGELSTRPEVSPDAAIDTLRIEVFDDQNREVDERTFVVADSASWPISFGIEPSAALGQEVRVRVRAFRALFATSTLSDGGAATLEAPSEVTLDRLVALSLPASLSRVRVTLRTDCMGTPSSFGPLLQTCLDGSHPAADPHEGIDALDTPPTASSVGTWATAISVPCKTAPAAGQVCVPGGFFILGDLAAAGNGETDQYETVPLRPVVLSPFVLDRDEMTVGSYRAVAANGGFTGTMPTPGDPTDPNHMYCTWGALGSTSEALPLNCILYATAQQVCTLLGGQLPTEAQWEFAARGRGERRDYPWGDALPLCCSASLGRAGPPGAYTPTCPEKGLEPVGSHPVAATCLSSVPGEASMATGDVTRDGIRDMAGSLSEMLADDLQSFSSPCWTSAAILRDPTCHVADPSAATPVVRGSCFDAGLATAYLAFRNALGPMTNSNDTLGFRCAYADGPP